MNTRWYPTLRLLNASTVVAISAGIRLHIAFLLAGLPVRLSEYCAFALIMYATYTLDRSLDCKEDAINKSELCGADRNVGLFASIVAFLAGAVLLGLDGIYLAPFLPFIIGYFYSKGIRIGSFRLKLKGGLGMKNIIVGLTWSGTIALILVRWCGSIQTIGVIFLFYGLKIFGTSSINDFKDVRGDTTAGIRTLPAVLGENLTKKVLIIMLVGIYSIMACAVYLHVIRNEWIVLLFSLVVTIAFLLVYSPSFENSPALIYRKMREFVISWEPVIALGLRACVAG
jgi:4-hydroxybenzoate polyprenyltransferase